MEKSIENIWNQQHPVIPKLKGLYQRKSKITVDRIRQTQKWDNRGLWLLAISLLAGFGYGGHWVLGGYTAALMIVLFFYNRNIIRQLDAVQFTDNVQQYLENYLYASKRLVRHYSRLLLFGAPLMALPAVSFWLHKVNPGFDRFIEQEPWYIIAIAYLFFGIIIGLYSWGVYRVVTHMLYGARLRILRDTLIELEELSS